MIEKALLILVAATLAAVLYLVIALRKRSGGAGSGDEYFEKYFSRIEKELRDEFSRSRNEANASAKNIREELNTYLKNSSEISTGQLKNLTQANETGMEKMRETLEKRLKAIQDDNSEKLEKMRATVDEKLHATLETRLNDSFKIVSDRLELVHKGLGEMQSLATGVGDLKKMLSNVKTKGILGEYQLGNILEQILSPGQYEKNVATKKDSADIVEFAVKLPGRKDADRVVWLPIDSKFPLEVYHSLVTAYDCADPQALEETSVQLERTIKKCAKDISEKYLDPPNTTDFAVMFLPIEGLYAEVVRRTGLIETLQREYKVVISGPTTLAAFLNSLHMGFRTLAIEKRSSEIWSLLGAVKTEFGRFGEFLEDTRKKLEEASNKIAKASSKSRTIEQKLKDVEELPPAETSKYFNEKE